MAESVGFGHNELALKGLKESTISTNDCMAETPAAELTDEVYRLKQYI